MATTTRLQFSNHNVDCAFGQLIRPAFVRLAHYGLRLRSVRCIRLAHYGSGERACIQQLTAAKPSSLRASSFGEKLTTASLRSEQVRAVSSCWAGADSNHFR
jgi:hypothetical protein